MEIITKRNPQPEEGIGKYISSEKFAAARVELKKTQETFFCEALLSRKQSRKKVANCWVSVGIIATMRRLAKSKNKFVVKFSV